MGTISTSRNMTIVGISIIVGALAAAAYAYFDGDPTTAPDLIKTLSVIMAGVAAIMGKGAQSTGGTVDNKGTPILDPAPPATVPTAAVPSVNVSPKGFARLGVVLVLALAGCAGVSALSGSTGPIPVTVEKNADGAAVATSTVTISTTPSVLTNGSCLKPLSINFDSLAGHHDACTLTIPLRPTPSGACP